MFLSWKANQLNFNDKLIKSAYVVNQQVVDWTIKIKKNINKKDKILFLGISYKKDVDDIRESAALKIFKEFKIIRKNNVDYYDPLVSHVNLNKEIIPSLKKL